MELLCVWMLFWVSACGEARAIEVRVSAKALERTAKAQMFSGPQGRLYLKGDSGTPCAVYVEAPAFSFRDDRIVVRVMTHARLGTSVRGACLGIWLNTAAVVSMVPQAEGESIGFRDARIERMSNNPELNFLLTPFLNGRLPQQMKVNAAEMMRKVLATSTATTGYGLTLSRLKLHSLQVDRTAVVLDADGDLQVE